MVAGDQLRLNCRATNDPQSPNKLRFTWYKDSTFVNTRGTQRHIITVPNGNSFIFFENLDVNQDNGTYTCNVDNFELSRAVTQSTVVIVESKWFTINVLPFYKLIQCVP